ncbi:hypothetical protein [Vibrio breoganii]|nr:hypothetical protein [Vibrio breoganii]
MNRQIRWDWRQVRNQYRRDHMARVELAVWHDEQLLALCSESEWWELGC